MKEYYDRRAPEYDDWYLGRGGFAERERPGWVAELGQLTETLAGLEPARTLDVACGTGFLTRHLRGEVTGLDASTAMLDEARRQAPHATLVQGNGLELPFPDDAFDRVFTGHFYGHLDEAERARFGCEVHRVARELVVVDAAVRPDHAREEIQQRELNDGTVWPVLKRYFTPAGLATELGGGETLFDGKWFVAVRNDRERSDD